MNSDHAYRAAREVYEQEPRNPDYAATYAFSLYLQGDVKKALQALAGFSEAELEQPQIAASYGVLLANIGDFWRAAKFLDLGEKANLLPEEKNSSRRRSGRLHGVSLVARGGTRFALLDRL